MAQATREYNNATLEFIFLSYFAAKNCDRIKTWREVIEKQKEKEKINIVGKKKSI